MEAEGSLLVDKNLTDEQWLVIKDTTTLLEPFMCAQRLLEGESYVTVSMIPFIIWKVRKGLVHAIESPHSSSHIVELATLLNNKFSELWGAGNPGTVATEHLTEGPRRRPKGIPKLALIASILDPRFKFGAGLSNEDKDSIWTLTREMMMEVVAQQMPQQDQVENADVQPNNVRNHAPQENQTLTYVDRLLLELNDFAAVDQAVNVEPNNREQDVMNQVDTELLLYKREQHPSHLSYIAGKNIYT
jgi:hypothetical protein